MEIILNFVTIYHVLTKHLLHQYNCLWPDMGIPASTDYMLRFVDTVRRDIRPDLIGPIVVHCRYFVESLFYCLFLNAHFLGRNQDNIYERSDVSICELYMLCQ
jgi:hypothetical protein